MKGDGDFGMVLRWLGGGWETSEREHFEVIQTWGSLPLARTESAVAREDCFAWTKGYCPELRLFLFCRYLPEDS